MGIMGTPTFDAAQPTIAPPPPPAPAPQPAPLNLDQFTQVGTTKKGHPVGQFGNRLNTPAGRAKEAQQMAAAAAERAQAAMRVAQSEANLGRVESSQTAMEAAKRAADQHVSLTAQSPGSGGRPSVNVLNAVAAHTKQIKEQIEPLKTQPPKKDEDDDTKKEVVQPTNFRPTAPITAPSAPKPKIVKNPNRDVIDLSREEFSLSSISRLVFEQVGSIELSNIARRDTIEGQNPYYELISNLSSIRKNFDPTSIISRQKSNQNISSNYTIRLNDKIPDDQYLERNNLEDFYYIDSNGDLVIELDNLSPDEIIDFEIATSGTINLVDEA